MRTLASVWRTQLEAVARTMVSKVDRSCVCCKTLKDDYTLNLKAKLVFFGLNHGGEFIL